MEKVIVTGGAGFIGSHLCELLLSRGYFVYCVDNLLTGSERNIKYLLNNPNFRFIKFDVTQSRLPIDEANYVFHLASPASPADFKNLSEEIVLVNSLGTLNLLRFSQKNGARFLLASTSEVYGDAKEHPQKETYWGYANSYGARSCYDESKRFGEALAYVFSHKYNLDLRIIRIFNTYGPRMRRDDGRVISNFINQAIEEKPITVYGKGDHSRSFCYVSDLVAGIEKVMFTPGMAGEVFNLGNPEEYKIIDLAEKIKKMTGSSSEIVFKNLPEDDPVQRCPDISKIKKTVGWEPKVGVNEGLAKTIEYYKSL